MTTTIYRKVNSSVSITSDSRVTLVDKAGMPIQWYDSTDFLKTVGIDGDIYGFAGANIIFKNFLDLYTSRDKAEFLLDTLVSSARENSIQFFILRYDGLVLKLFAYSPPSPNGGDYEIYRVSQDPVIEESIYAIGSGRDSKEYKKNKISPNAQVPIRRIIAANLNGLKKHKLLHLDVKAASETLTPEESKSVFLACKIKGGDIFTGGEIKVTQHISKQQIEAQVAILNGMDMQAKALGAVCASPVNAALEVKHLQKIGQYPVSHHVLEITNERQALLEKIQNSINLSLIS